LGCGGLNIAWGDSFRLVRIFLMKLTTLTVSKVKTPKTVALGRETVTLRGKASLWAPGTVALREKASSCRAECSGLPWLCAELVMRQR